MENTILDQPSQDSSDYNFNQKVEQLLANGYNFNLGEYISSGHRILMKNFGGFAGYFLLVILISIGLGIIPFIGSIANFIIGYSLIMGFAIVSRRIHYTKPFRFGNFFDGFKFLGPLVLVRLLITIIVLVVALPYIFIALWPLFKEIIGTAFSGGTPDIDPQFILSQMLKIIPLILVLMIGQALFTFSPFMVVFGRTGVWESITNSVKIVWKRILHFILFFIVLFFINMGGAILIGIGLFYTIPLSFCAVYAAYELIVGTNSNDEMLDRM